MGRGKNKQTNSGLGAQPKETKEQRRQRLADEAQARESCMKVLPYAIGLVVFLLFSFALWIHTLPPKPIVTKTNPAEKVKMPTPGEGGGMTFEEALAAQTDVGKKESMKKLFDQVDAELKAKQQEMQEEENVINLDGDEL